MKFKYLIFTIIFIASFFSASQAFAIEKKSSYPKIANYFLKWDINDKEAEKLANWDLLILDMELSINSPDKIKRIREINPDVVILAYITAQEIIDDVYSYPNAILRQELYRNIDDSWWLRDKEGKKIVYWPNTSMLNVSDGAGLNEKEERFNDYLPQFVMENIQSTGLWDGVFYDNTWGDVSWVDRNIDINNNRRNSNSNHVDDLWSGGFKKILQRTRDLTGDDFVIVGNGRVYHPYLPHLHGMMLEGFPSYWESGGTWEGSINTYLKLPNYTRKPSLTVINKYHKDREDYQKFRFGLGSALLSDGYYSFDYDVSNHTQTWWYDEYEVYLGKSISPPFNLLKDNNNIEAGLWRRDFENGVVIVNSSQEKQRIVFENEVLEKISGTQDEQINSGEKINWLEIEARDAIILLKEMNIVNDSSFTNGEFLRVFDSAGKLARSGFFAYLQGFSGSSQILLHDLNGNNSREQIVSYDGEVKVYQNSLEILSFSPFHHGFKGKISIAAADLNGNGQKEIIVGAGPGGGPQVRVYNLQGDCVSTFFAYDKNFRGGIDVAVGDTNGNGKYEIITGAGSGGGPHIRIFDYRGRELSTFFAYDKNFRGGVNVASADTNLNNKYEIISGSGPGSKAEVKVFNDKGETINNFLAIDDYLKGINVSVFDSTGNGKAEIFVGIKHY